MIVAIPDLCPLSYLNMNQTYLIYHKSIPAKGVYVNSVKLLLVLSILVFRLIWWIFIEWRIRKLTHKIVAYLDICFHDMLHNA